MKQIPPGGEGKITVKVDTHGYGGKKITEQAKIYTNDPKHPLLIVTIKGFVEHFAIVSPKMVRLVGQPGKPLVSRVTIEKKPEYPFKITNIRAWRGKFIKYHLEEMQDSDSSGYVLVVECTKKDSGRFVDTIYLKTDSNIQPEISIIVMGNIYDG